MQSWKCNLEDPSAAETKILPLISFGSDRSDQNNQAKTRAIRYPGYSRAIAR
jgi:hypothetical protein